MQSVLIILGLFVVFSCGEVEQVSGNNNIVVYWGQDSAGGTGNLERNLAYYCSQSYSIITLAFMISFVDPRQPSCAVPNGPDLNFANHGNNCTTFPNCPFLLDCANSIGADIRTCQSQGKKIVLSLGGAVGSYGFTSDSQATQFARTIWDMFFEGKGPLRPFGNVVLDGVDLDIEGGSSGGYATFVKALRSLMGGNSRYIISGAPQCPFPDAYLGPSAGKALGDAASSFTYVNVQFYNNYCGANSANNFWDSYAQWHAAAEKGGYKIMVGLPAAPRAGGGYVSPSTACGLVSRLKTYSTFAGFMLWDASWDMNNNWFSRSLKQCLG